MVPTHCSAVTPMEKVDIAIAVVGAVALLATGLGVAFYDDINGLTEYTIESQVVDASGSGSGSSATIELDVPDNMYHLMGDITVAFSSPNPAASCTINVDITVTAPTGESVAFEGSGGIGDGSVTVPVESVKFGDAPEDFSGDADDKEANTLSWDEPVTIVVNSQDTGCGAPVLGVGGVTYGNVDFAGEWHGYSIEGEDPEPEAA